MEAATGEILRSTGMADDQGKQERIKEEPMQHGYLVEALGSLVSLSTVRRMDYCIAVERLDHPRHYYSHY